MLEEEHFWSLIEICMIQELVSATADLQQERMKLYKAEIGGGSSSEMCGPNLERRKVFLPASVTWFEAEDGEGEVTENLLIPEMEMEILCISLKPFRSARIEAIFNFGV